MKTIIQTEIKGDVWLSTTPHNKDFKGEAATESDSINALIAEIRQAMKDAVDEGIDWDANAKASKGKDAIVRQVTGCWPAVIKEKPKAQKAERKDVTDAN